MTLVITVLATVVPGVAAWLMVLLWPRSGRRAAAASTEATNVDAHRHSTVVEYLNSRFSAESTMSVALGVAAAIVLVASAAIGILVLMIHTHSGLARWDRGASLFAAHHASVGPDRLLKTFTRLGGALVIVPLALLVAIIETVRQRTAIVAVFLTLVMGGQSIIANVVKFLIERARPAFDQLSAISGSSFPSGHAAATSAGLAAMALVIGRGRPLKTRAVLAGVAVGLATGVSCTRVMLGVHWMTDVIGGLTIGWAWFAVCSVSFDGRRPRYGRPVTSVDVSSDLRLNDENDSPPK